MSRSSTRRPRRRNLVLVAAGTLLLAAVVLVLLALPMRAAPAEASAARADLVAAKTALAAGDIAAAEAAVADARRHADAVQDATQGPGGDVWSMVPLAGGPVRDVRRLGTALDELTSAAEIGVETWPAIRGEDATLLGQGDVDLETLEVVTRQVREAHGHLQAAQAQLVEVADERLVTGTRLAEARDQARDELDPVVDGMRTVDPLLDVLPQMLGANNDKKYLVALLNPAEMQYSGGTPLSFVTVGFNRGDLILDDAFDVSTAPGVGQQRYWRKVKGNVFHRGRTRLSLATQAPDWSVAGHELANGWRSLRGRRLSGIIAIDVVAIAELVGVTGPLTVPHLGELTEDNLVEKLIGSYDQQTNNAKRKETNRALASLFASKLLQEEDLLATGEAVSQAADQRRFAVFMRNPAEQDVFDSLGLTGRLSDTPHDYVGVFTANRNGNKSDYWQRRTVATDVVLAKDGSARVRMQVTVHNDSPPYVQPEPDPRRGYYTRWNSLSIAPFLPLGATFDSAAVDGKPIDFSQRRFFGRFFIRPAVEFAPQARHTLEVTYDVPQAALRRRGGLVYRLDLDPQGMVDPQAVDVRVRFPRGLAIGDLPPGWDSPRPGVASYVTADLETSESFEIEAHPAAG